MYPLRAFGLVAVAAFLESMGRKSFSGWRAEGGFSLIEVMIVLTLMGLVGGVALPLLKQHQQAEALRATKHHQERIFYALAAFIQTQGRLPCPADPSDKARFGQERLRCQSIALATGLVPFKTLGLPEGVAKSGQLDFFTYVVHPELTITRNLEGYCKKDVRHLVPLSSDEPFSHPFDPVAVLLKSHRPARRMLPKGVRPQGIRPQGRPVKSGFQTSFDVRDSVDERWETRQNLAAFYGRLFCHEAL